MYRLFRQSVDSFRHLLVGGKPIELTMLSGQQVNNGPPLRILYAGDRRNCEYIRRMTYLDGGEASNQQRDRSPGCKPG